MEKEAKIEAGIRQSIGHQAYLLEVRVNEMLSKLPSWDGVPPSEVTRLPPLWGAARFYYSAAPSGLPRGAGCEASQPDNRAALNVIAMFAANSCTNGLPFAFAELSIQSAAHCRASLWPNIHDAKTG